MNRTGWGVSFLSAAITIWESFGVVAGVDQDNSFLGLDDRHIRVVELRRVNVNAVFDLFKLWTESPAPRSDARENKKGRNEKKCQYRFLLS